ncbi:MAG TPA: aminotransferase class V-fold PLP-dependent enzyme [Vicinamibacterales bacterium]|jgi:selenocysteine lyase/cysteine desulfurase|nr:aminotransferase class V-fold PLP-dependent enzyme [Vicinamibacterales bacterium]
MLMRATDRVAGLRAREFARLDRTATVYLDYTGAALYPASLVRRDARRLRAAVRGNPHAESGPSCASTAATERARALTLEFCGADPAVYDVVFAANASGAIRILAEAFPFDRNSRLVLTADNHNSVNGLAWPARRAKARATLVALAGDLRGTDPEAALVRVPGPSLFAFPAQSNFSGVRHPLEWVRVAQARGYRVLLDAASFAPGACLDLRAAPADFVALSFYKIFGYPTGIGALIARRDALAALRRRYFGGGTVDYVSMPHWLVQRKVGAARFEDGTVSFLAMDAVCDGLRWMSRLGVDAVARHGAAMTERLLEMLQSCGEAVEVYGPDGMNARGGTVAFNVRRDGRLLPYEQVEAAARARGIAIRGGCFCNPGAAAHALGLDAARMRACLRGDFSIPRFRDCMGDGAVGALRASVGLATNDGDIQRLGALIAGVSAGRS